MTEEPSTRPLALLMVVAGAIGTLAAGILTVERIKLLTDPFYVPSCTLDEILTCTSVMTSDQAEAFGFPNPLIGLAAFPVVTTTGATLLAGATLARWYWRSLQVGVLAGLGFVGWLITQSLYDISALCPYCMAVWAAVIPLAWYVTLHNARAGHLGESVRRHPLTRALWAWHALGLVVLYLVVATMVLIRFWSYWIG